MATTLDALVGTPPEEFGGQRATNRLNYQRDWTFCLLLKLHLGQEDYLIVCDYHDDLLLLNGSVSPTKIDAFQVKSSQKKSWSVASLLAQETGKAGLLPSVLGKMYRNRLKFSSLAASSHFVSNQPFSIELVSDPKSGDRTMFTADEIESSEKAKIVARLKTELRLSFDPIIDASLVFSVSDLSVRGHAEQTRGKLSDFLESRDASRTYPIGALYRVIADHIAKCIAHESACTSVVDLIALKSISRVAFEKMIVDCLTVADAIDPDKLKRDYENVLREEQVPLLAARRLRKAFERYLLERLDRGRLNLQRLIDCLHSFHLGNRQQVGTKLMPYLQTGLSVARGKGFIEPDDEAVMAVLAWEVLTDEGSVSPSDPQPSEHST